MRFSLSYVVTELLIFSLNVFKSFQTTHPEERVSFWVKETGEVTVTSIRSMFQIRKEEFCGKFLVPVIYQLQ